MCELLNICIEGFITRSDGQGIGITSRMLADPDFDTYFHVCVKVKDCYTVCTVHAIHLM